MSYIIYKHTCITTGKSYIGVTKHAMESRWREHKKAAKKGLMSVFHCAIRKHGTTDWIHEVIERMTTEAGALKAEQLWIAHLNTVAPNGYNSCAGGKGTLNPSDETRHRISIAASSPSASTRQKMSDAKKGKSLSNEHRNRISAGLIGKKREFSDEHRRNISIANTRRKGEVRSSTTRRRMRETLERKRRHRIETILMFRQQGLDETDVCIQTAATIGCSANIVTHNNFCKNYGVT